MKHVVYKTAVAIVAMMATGSFGSAGAAPLGATDKPSPNATKPSVTKHHPEQHLLQRESCFGRLRAPQPRRVRT